MTRLTELNSQNGQNGQCKKTHETVEAVEIVGSSIERICSDRIKKEVSQEYQLYHAKKIAAIGRNRNIKKNALHNLHYLHFER